MSQLCGNCRHFATAGGSSVCALHCVKTSYGGWCRNHEDEGQKRVFEHITTSPEKLADSIVIEMEDFTEDGERRIWWESPIMPQGYIYHTRQEAYEATLARLKEVEVRGE